MSIILCCGQNGRAVVFGTADSKPEPGKPVTLRDARMLLYWAGRGGLFGVAANGPDSESRITAAVPCVVETVWQEWLSVSDKAAAALRDYPVTK